MRDYRKIQAWQLADDLTVAVYRCTRGFPKEEQYGLTSQLRRASYSVPSNICEGATRESKKDYLHFLYIARASLSETEYFIHLSKRLGYLTDQDCENLNDMLTDTFKRLHGLVNAVRKEAGVAAKVGATVSSFLVVALARLVA